MDLGLVGKVALVTGGSRSIGRAVALELGREGATVIVNYRSASSEADRVVQEIVSLGSEAYAVRADVGNHEAVTTMFADVWSKFGRLDILVNNAGIIRRTPFVETDERDWRAVLDTNLTGYFLCGQAAARLMIKQSAGAIVNMSSANEEVASRNVTAYAVAKGGVRMLTRQMAYELAPHGIRVNSVAPGMIETDLNRSNLQDPAFRAEVLAAIPMGVVGSPVDVAGAVAYLASSRASFVSGATLVMDGAKSIV
jgi:glucose 1-dehydrogenase